MSKLKVGDYVRVLRMWTNEEADAAGAPRCNTVGAMDDTVGALGQVVDIGSDYFRNIYHVMFDTPINTSWYYPDFVLEKVVPIVPEIDMEVTGPGEFGVIDSYGLW